MPIHGYPGNIITANPTAPTVSAASGVWTTEQQLQAVSQGNWPGYEYPISRSLRFNSADTAYLNRTFGTSTNQSIFTYSVWVKLGRTVEATTNYGSLLSGYTASSDTGFAEFHFYSGTLRFGGWSTNWRVTTQVFRDPSSWYHVVLAVDTTQATAANRIKMYVNGSEITAFSTNNNPTQNSTVGINNNSTTGRIGQDAPASSTRLFDGYMTEINFIDGQALTPSSFGLNDPETGIWSPKQYTGTYGTNGFYLNFSDNSNTTAATLGKDYSGNGNNWTPNNFSVTAGAGNDSLVDTPTSYGTDTGAGGEVRGNYCTWNGVSIGTDATLANGNLDISYGSGITRNGTMGTFGMSSGKWYWEVTITASSASPTNAGIGISNNPSSSSVANYPGFTSTSWGYVGDGNKYNNSSPSAYGATYTTNDVISFAFDVDAGSITAYKNGVSQGVMFSGLAANTYYPAIGDGGGASTFTAAANFGQRPFVYTAPSGFKALCTQNLPTPTIGATSTTQAGKYMNVVLYTATPGTGATVSGVGFQPDLLWTKNRDNAESHYWQDAVRGFSPSSNVTRMLSSNLTSAEYSLSDITCTPTSDGFTVVDSSPGSGEFWFTNRTYVGWCWNAGGSNATNTSGTITSTVRANTTAGFSIVTYTGTGANGTVGHGLGVAPSMIIVKRRDGGSDNWQGYHISLGKDYTIKLNTTQAQENLSNYWGSGGVTSTVFGINGTYSGINANGGTYVAYCFAAVAGYSAFGSYTGNGSTDGPFVYLGFRPEFVFWKNASTTGDWQMKDAARSTYNVTSANLYANLSNAENSAGDVDFLSNGFKIRSAGTDVNGSGNTIIYAAFAESPFKYALAR